MGNRAVAPALPEYLALVEDEELELGPELKLLKAKRGVASRARKSKGVRAGASIGMAKVYNCK